MGFFTSFFVTFLIASTSALRVTLMGMSGMGKSSLVRELCPAPSNDPDDVIISHAGEGTMSSTVHQACNAGAGALNWTVRDAPGYGTPQFPTGEGVFKELNETDHIILCVGHRIYTQDLEFFRHVPFSMPVTIARLKCDLHPCNDNQLRFLGAKVFEGTTVFGVSTVKEHVRYGEIAKLVDYISQYDSLHA